MPDFDLIVRGGRLIDGTGSPERTADVAILDGKIAEVGQVSGSAADEIDANGALVTPGFVDIHTHYDGQVTWSERLSPSSHHGVTTVVMGNCGVGFAPVRNHDHDLLVRLMEGVEDIPGAALHEGLPWAWESFPDYLNFLDARRYDMDVAAQLPHAALRVYVMGERGANRDPATADDIAVMRQLTREAIEAGALGFTSSRTLNHRSSTGDPTPSLTAEQQELVGIGLGIKDAGRGVLEMISDFQDVHEEFGILMEMTRQSGTSMTISLAQGLNPHGWKKLLGMIDEANRQGLKVKGQVAPRGIGILLGLTATLNPFMMHPSFREIAGLPLEQKVARLRDPGFREKLLSEEPAKEQLARLFGDFGRIWALGDPPEYEPAPEDSLEARAGREGKTPHEIALDVMLMNDGRQLLYTPFANYAEFNLDCCREMILADNTVM
ncbi:MAG: amidohydrolase family protein, partial [Pseudomonadales bacterium]|nr:amidohydrolase family protein [Pseudomonadales bacterium]